ncbi:hypothetical protein Sgou_34350 [Streptomyces gougerotii]|uniref:Cation/acetate symporter ActP n=1 Tax=Streptomyces gougerotii TaxID=53448 RepID=A0ABQ1D871_9ACTN|nr:hypothetical protein Sgou_34350 [Streptomyces gougerotii]
MAVARLAAAGTGVPAIGLSLLARDLNVAFLVGLAFAVAASANPPVLLYTLFWRSFTTRGAVRAVYGGLVPAVLLVLVPPVESGSPASLLPGLDFQVFPLENPGLVSVPLGFASGWPGTVTSREKPDEDGHAEAEVRSLTGAGAVRPGCGRRFTPPAPPRRPSAAASPASRRTTRGGAAATCPRPR